MLINFQIPSKRRTKTQMKKAEDRDKKKRKMSILQVSYDSRVIFRTFSKIYNEALFECRFNYLCRNGSSHPDVFLRKGVLKICS